MALMHSILALIQHLFFIVAGLFGIGFLIGWHELGHFLFCKLFYIATPSFSIGMGPRLLTKKIGQTEFALSAIPLGGYVEIAGAAEVGQGEQKEAYSIDQYSFAQKPYYQKLLVMVGGILFNIIFSYVVLSGLYFFGMPKSALLYPRNASTVISSVEDNSPAKNYGLQEGDTIIAIDGTPVKNPEKLMNIVKAKANQPASITIRRNGQKEEKNIIVGEKTIQKTTFGYLGIDFVIPTYPFLKSIKMGIQSTHYIMWQVWVTFKNIFTHRAIDNIGGPLMVISQTIKGAERGIKVFLLLLAFISVNLAVLNILPLPIMDGGQILFYTIEAIIRRPLPEKVKMYIHYACWLGVIALALFLSVKDVLRLIFPPQA